MADVYTRAGARRERELWSAARGWSRVRFSLLPVGEANEWLEAQGATARIDRDASLAELFALAGGRDLASQPPVGCAG